MVSILFAFDHQVGRTDARALAGLAQKVAQKIQHSKDDFEKIDHERSWLERNAGWVAVGLAVLSFVPVVGDVIDGAQCLMGDAIACASVMVPGSLSAANKARKVINGVDNAADAVRGLDNLGDATRALDNVSDATRTSSLRKVVGKVCHSFAALTLVLMADGSARSIDRVEVGDRVAAVDVVSGEQVSAEVSVLHRNFDSDLVDVEVVDGGGSRSVVHTTSRHLWWSLDRYGWVEAADLVAGERLRSADGERVEVVDARWVGASEWMFDLTVDGVHTFQVLAGGTPVLVHNSNADQCLNPGATNYAGGRHADLDAPPGIQRHHMPADSASPLSTGKGPSIQMDTVDHRQTASWGRSQAAQDYRAQQADLIGQGRFDDAVQMDIDDVIARWPGKYDHAILQMIDSL